MGRVVRAMAAASIAAMTWSCGGGSSSPSSPSPVAGTSTSTSTVASTTTTSVPASTTTTSVASSTTTTVSSVTVAYENDIKPILDADCVQCHSPTNRNGNVDLSTYASVLRVVTPGSANSTLVRVTQSNGIMYNNLTGNRASKSALIRSWVVDNNAAQSR